MLEFLKDRAQMLQRETCALYYACRDPRTPWSARVLALAVVAYAVSPIDLIPDPIPVLGMLDDLVIIPAGVALVLRLVPSDVTADARRRAGETMDPSRASGPLRMVGAILVVLAWLLILALVARLALG